MGHGHSHGGRQGPWTKKKKLLLLLAALLVLTFIYLSTRPSTKPEDSLIPVDFTQVCDGGRVAQIRWSPRTLLYKGFLTEQERLYLLESAKTSLTTNFNNIFERSNETNARAVYLTLSDVEIHKRIEDRLVNWVMIPPGFSEPLTARRYRVGEYHSPHYDYLPSSDTGAAGQRLATVLIFLESATAGGEFVIPRADLTVRPNPGDAIVIHNRLPNGQNDVMSQNAISVVTQGELYVLSKFFREKHFTMVWETSHEKMLVSLPRRGFNPILNIIYRSISTKQYNLMLMVKSKQKDHAGVKELFEKMKSEGEIPSVATYNILIGSSGSNKLFSEGIQYFNEMLKNKIEPNQYTYTYLFQLCAATKRQEQALIFYERMKAKGIEANDILKTAVVDAFASSKIQGDSLELLKRIENFINDEILVNVNDVSVINAVIKFYVSQDKATEAKKLLDSISTKFNLQPDTITNNLVMQINKGNPDFIFSHFEEMKKNKTINQRTFVNLFTILKNNKDLSRLEDVYSYLESSHTERNIYIYSSMFDCFNAYNLYDRIFDNYDRMKNAEYIKPNDAVLVVLLRACSQLLTSSTDAVTSQHINAIHTVFQDAINLKLTPTTLNNREFVILFINLLEYHFRNKSAPSAIVKLVESFKRSQFHNNSRLRSAAAYLSKKHQPGVEIECLLHELTLHKTPK